MALLYVVSGLVIILLHITSLPDVILNIVTGAFGLRPVLAGTAGSMIIAMQKGIARGLYSNEAGEGSAPVIHSAANVQHPVEQGITGGTEVFLDTFLICTISGLVLWRNRRSGFRSAWKHSDDTRFFHSVGSSEISGHHQPAFILHHNSDESVVLRFCWPKLSVRSPDRGKFRYFFPLFCMIGSITAIDVVWTIQDIALGLLTIPNMIVIDPAESTGQKMLRRILEQAYILIIE